jgi:hypothetical protein
VGYQAGYSVSALTGSFNTLVGGIAGAGLIGTSNSNVFVGYASGNIFRNPVTVTNTVGVGTGAASWSLSTAAPPSVTNNVSIGFRAGYVLTGAAETAGYYDNTTFIGANAGSLPGDQPGNTNLNNSVGIGFEAMLNTHNGGWTAPNVTAIGTRAFNITTGSNVTGSICVGYYSAAIAPPGDISNSIYIGNDLVPTGPNEIIIGKTQTKTTIAGSLVSSPASSTWAGLPAAAGAAGTVYRVTDIGVGGSLWYSDGSRWRAVGGRVNLFEMEIPITTSGNNVETTVILFGPLPANFLQQNDVLTIQLSGTKNAGVDTCYNISYIGPTGTNTDQVFGESQLPLTKINFASLDQIKLKSGTNSQLLLISTATINNPAPYGATNQIIFPSPVIDKSLAQYINVTSFMSTGGLTTETLFGCRVTLETC